MAELQKRINKLSGQSEHSSPEQIETTAAGLAEQTTDSQAQQGVTSSEMKVYQVTFANKTIDRKSEPELTLLDSDTVAGLFLQKITAACKQCCCFSHCKVANHHTIVWKKATELANPFKMHTVVEMEDAEEILDDDTPINTDYNLGDGLTSLLMNVNIKF